MTPLVTIDFGTSLSSAAVVLGDRVLTVKEPASGSYSLPSAVYADDEGPLLVGTPAENAKRRRPDRYRSEFKRDLGRSAQITLGERAFAVEDLVAAVLASLRAQAEAVAGAEVTRAVLTVPAGAGTPQREAMLDAAAIAGFDRSATELLEEPVAASFAPAAGAALPPGEPVLVYDFGGGTFDAALVRIGSNGRGHEILDHSGLPHCGGYDVDQLVYGEILAMGGEDAARRLAIDPESDERSAQAARRAQLELLDITRRIKHQLSAASSGGDYFIDREYVVTRERFDELVTPLVEQTLTCCLDLLDRNQLEPDKVAAVLLVGGSTRMPVVAETLTRRLARPLRRAEDPELAVAVGAAHQRAAAPSPTARRAKPQSAQAQANVTTLIQDPDWAQTPESARSTLLDAVLSGPEETIDDLITDARVLIPRTYENKQQKVRVKVAVLVTSVRVLWVRTASDDEPRQGETALADVVDIVPLSTAQHGLRGFRLVTEDGMTELELPEQDNAFRLNLIDTLVRRTPAGEPKDHGVLLGGLTQLTNMSPYNEETKSGAWLAHAVVSAKAPERVAFLDSSFDGVTKLLTTSERLVWARDGEKLTTGQVALADITGLGAVSTKEAGLMGVTVRTDRKTETFRIKDAHVNAIYLQERVGRTLARWPEKVSALVRFPGWTDLDARAQNRLEHALVSVDEDEEVRAFVHCQYETFGFWGRRDGSKTTGLVVTSKRVVWARFGSVAGLTAQGAGLELVRIDQVLASGLTITVEGEKHGFLGFKPDHVVAQLRRAQG